MEIFYWVLIGLFAAFLAKVTFPADRDEGILGLLAVGILGAVLGGWIMHALALRGMMGSGVWSEVVAFVGAVVLLVLQRAVTGRRMA